MFQVCKTVFLRGPTWPLFPLHVYETQTQQSNHREPSTQRAQSPYATFLKANITNNKIKTLCIFFAPLFKCIIQVKSYIVPLLYFCQGSIYILITQYCDIRILLFYNFILNYFMNALWYLKLVKIRRLSCRPGITIQVVKLIEEI